MLLSLVAPFLDLYSIQQKRSVAGTQKILFAAEEGQEALGKFPQNRECIIVCVNTFPRTGLASLYTPPF